MKYMIDYFLSDKKRRKERKNGKEKVKIKQQNLNKVLKEFNLEEKSNGVSPSQAKMILNLV